MIFPSENSRLKLKDYFINNCFGDVISLICFECFQTWITRVCLCRHKNQTNPLAVQSRQTLLITVSKCFKKLKLIYKICNRLERNYNVKIVIAKCFFFLLSKLFNHLSWSLQTNCLLCLTWIQTFFNFS